MVATMATSEELEDRRRYRREYARAYYWAFRDKILADYRAHRNRNPAYRAQQKRWYDANKDKINARRRELRALNKDKYNEYQRAYRARKRQEKLGGNDHESTIPADPDR